MMFDGLWAAFVHGPKKGADRLRDFLRTVPLFEELSDRELQLLTPKIYLRQYMDGEAIFQEGDPSLGMYVVLSGTVRIVHQPKDGPATVLATLAPGAFFGELGLLDDAPRSASAIACGATEALGFFKPELIEVVKRYPDLGMKIFLAVATMISGRLRRTNEELHKLRSKEQEGSSA